MWAASASGFRRLAGENLLENNEPLHSKLRGIKKILMRICNKASPLNVFIGGPISSSVWIPEVFGKNFVRRFPRQLTNEFCFPKTPDSYTDASS
jgi:hypothetical protein